MSTVKCSDRSVRQYDMVCSYQDVDSGLADRRTCSKKKITFDTL